MTSYGDEDLTYWVKQSYKGYIIEVEHPKYEPEDSPPV